MKKVNDMNIEELKKKIHLNFTILGEYYNYDTKKTELLFEIRGEKSSISCDKLATRNKIINTLSSIGISCYEFNYKYYMKYIHEFRMLNDKN